jgi:hypothetical protein
MEDNFFDKLARGEIEPDLVITEEDMGAFDLRGVGATMWGSAPITGLKKIPIVYASPRLGYDLELAGYRTEAQLREVIEAIVEDSRATVAPGDVGYPIFVATPTIGGRQTKVWIQQIDDNAACIFYADEY